MVVLESQDNATHTLFPTLCKFLNLWTLLSKWGPCICLRWFDEALQRGCPCSLSSASTTFVAFNSALLMIYKITYILLVFCLTSFFFSKLILQVIVNIGSMNKIISFDKVDV